MNTQDIQNVGTSKEVVAQNNNSFAAKAKKAALAAKDVTAKAVFPVIATACTVSAVACAAYRIIELVRLVKGDEK